MKKIQIILVILASTTLLFLFKNKVLASDGTVELRSTQGTDSRCFAASLLMEDLAYTILVSCRDLIYPGEFGLINYALWAQPTDGTSTVFLGLLGYGKSTVRIAKPFNSLFVTIESQIGATPTGRVVMRGNVSPVTFLDRPTTATPTPGEETKQGEEQTQEGEQEQEQQPQSTRDKLFLALRRAGIAALIALVALIGLIFVVTRARG
ncbi:hypothetical protein A2962_02335 [Candidatus Woesebacteria bacterium RIFCSPLOWO2_01_FULL_39_61]|uniref:Uncharacterized protein n=1 Tax=Candidatus Woesebacteria bacterium RIFCSPHIGHO2_02_FULL_39_13 TaxID=1802505 RepID=A0A1F7Z3B1_9BACT|nr:MAG: hypothetical protein A2692_01350 [Candidatus Woesebacteria bacterium RIFCSPHIGHO2_01_FULL_39_95]OGM33997.1 MAG: hypothetical protein A3D01_03640 [Candidatus Woesebacteria bacterium RIFCSPHIGHO2_02_FULL_39_13]OGM38255.1 MAG: hypothetical protein A3E13_05750 [Candidatus Woesebacteria bacterium RIFCSPHIGHO2_12_FULL_40_20]OGM66961.1 MAG: hypothetical protein A2962_02335 [Candidatus Woesebacteria bacterium RIFCSPLOWO2_01_FULL_39_61]OGM75507.1 MAG: hypothetical protein A3H19_00575 [Candidatus